MRRVIPPVLMCLLMVLLGSARGRDEVGINSIYGKI
jgi:hypothetical protein